MRGSKILLFRPPGEEDRYSARIAYAHKAADGAAGDGRLVEDYALVSDRKTAALVSQAGAVDWLCLPRFDSPALFASLLGDVRNGSWSIAPTDQDFSSWRRYDDGSVILRTTFEARQGAVELIDFMPEGFDRSHFVRIVRGIRGRLEMQCKIAARFDYGVTIPWVTEINHQTYSFIAGAEVATIETFRHEVD